jgi:hypothetical protein
METKQSPNHSLLPDGEIEKMLKQVQHKKKVCKKFV